MMSISTDITAKIHANDKFMKRTDNQVSMKNEMTHTIS